MTEKLAFESTVVAVKNLGLCVMNCCGASSCYSPDEMTRCIPTPHTGMAVICASLVAPSGRVTAPQPGIVEVTPGGCGSYGTEMDLEQATNCQIVEVAEEHQSTGEQT